jgi:hypothetical protein
MKTPLLSTTLLALAGIAFIAQPAQAQTALTFNDGDLVLGFRDTAGANSAIDLEIDIGSATNFIAGGAYATGAAQTIAIGNIATDLSNEYTSGWNTSSTVLWSISGAAADGSVGTIPVDTLFATSQETTPGTHATAWTRKSVFTQQNPAGAINSMDSNYAQGTFGGQNQTISSNNSNLLIQTGSGAGATSNSYISWMANGANAGSAAAFGYFTGGAHPTEGSFANGTSGSVLDLFEMTPTASGTAPGVLLGEFKLDNSGDLTFTSAVPEPSTYAAILGALTLGLVAIRRRKQSQA